MKFALLLMLGASLPLNAATFYYLRPKSYVLLKKLPPGIRVELEYACKDRFDKLERFETINPKTQEVTISFVASIQHGGPSKCQGKRIEWKSGGDAFSGRAHKIELIDGEAAAALSQLPKEVLN